jgi:hypothetical protein
VVIFHFVPQKFIGEEESHLVRMGLGEEIITRISISQCGFQQKTKGEREQGGTNETERERERERE